MDDPFYKNNFEFQEIIPNSLGKNLLNVCNKKYKAMRALLYYDPAGKDIGLVGRCLVFTLLGSSIFIYLTDFQGCSNPLPSTS